MQGKVVALLLLTVSCLLFYLLFYFMLGMVLRLQCGEDLQNHRYYGFVLLEGCHLYFSSIISATPATPILVRFS
jgi:hypothetical protein